MLTASDTADFQQTAFRKTKRGWEPLPAHGRQGIDIDESEVGSIPPFYPAPSLDPLAADWKTFHDEIGGRLKLTIEDERVLFHASSKTFRQVLYTCLTGGRIWLGGKSRLIPNIGRTAVVAAVKKYTDMGILTPSKVERKILEGLLGAGFDS